MVLMTDDNIQSCKGRRGDKSFKKKLPFNFNNQEFEHEMTPGAQKKSLPIPPALTRSWRRCSCEMVEMSPFNDVAQDRRVNQDAPTELTRRI